MAHSQKSGPLWHANKVHHADILTDAIASLEFVSSQSYMRLCPPPSASMDPPLAHILAFLELYSSSFTKTTTNFCFCLTSLFWTLFQTVSRTFLGFIPGYYGSYYSRLSLGQVPREEPSWAAAALLYRPDALPACRSPALQAGCPSGHSTNSVKSLRASDSPATYGALQMCFD